MSALGMKLTVGTLQNSCCSCFLYEYLWITFHSLVSGYTGLCGNHCRVSYQQILLKFWADLERATSGLSNAWWLDGEPVTCPCNKAANSLLGCSWQSIANTSRGIILPLSSALVRHSWSSGSCSRLPSTRHGHTGEHWRATEMIKGLEHLSYKEGLRKPGLCSLKKKRLKGDFIRLNKCMKGGARKMEPGSF